MLGTSHPGPGVLFSGLLAILLTPLGLSAAEGPFRLNEALGVDEGFSVGLVHRSRFENLVDNVQPGTSENDQVLMMRTLLDMQYHGERFVSRVELADMRQSLADEDSVISNATVNSLDILQANVGYRFGAAGGTELRFGRFTEDWGSRRLMARNRFRNTINAWDGLLLHHALAGGGELKAMATQVVQRLPRDRRSLLDNEQEWDESFDAQRFYGLHLDLPNLIEGLSSELYYFALREKDSAELQTRNQRLDTVGFRLRSPRQPGAFDFELESVLQGGEARASASPADVTDLDHFAWFQYLSVGYSFIRADRLRVAFEFDYASGDESPFDDESGRFNSLFGPTTFEFGVVGLYNPFNRSNLITPGVSVTLDPHPRLNLMAFYRHFWLAEERDSWGRTGLRDVTGQSGDYLGQHLQLRLRWQAVPGNLMLETGAIFLNAESLSEKNTEYFYTGLTLTL